MKKFVLLLCCLVAMSSCTWMDNWILGKDNTIPPSKLTRVDEKVRLQSKWQQSVTQRRLRSEGFYHLRPTVKDGAVYTATADGTIQKRNPISGKLIWSHHLNATLASGPTVNHGELSVGTEDANLFLLNAQDGAVKWHKLLSNSVLASPMMTNHLVVAKTIDSKLYAFDKASGVLAWQYQERSPDLILRAASSPTAQGDLLVSGFADGKVMGFNLSGRPIWVESLSLPKGSSDVERMIDVDATPIITSQAVYAVGYQGQLAALSRVNGQKLWSRRLSSYQNMTLNRGNLYVTDSNGGVWAVSTRSGTVLWHQKALLYRHLTAPVASPLGLLIADKLGFVHVLSYETGSIIGRQKVTDDKIDAAPVASGRAVYVLTARGTLHHLIETSL